MPAKAKRLAVVGGGPAGMSAALHALRAGAQVVLLERNEKLGKKLYITGKGRCNVSNAAEGEDFLRNVPRNPRFLYAALRFLSPSGLRELLGSLGCETVVERGQRVFPASQKASDVTRALSLGIQGAEIRLNTALSAIEPKAEGGFLLNLSGGESISVDAVVLATGGLSYPLTGSTGDGHRLAQALDHPVTDCLAALVAMETLDEWPKRLQGLTLRNVLLTAKAGKKKLFSEQGELLFTHFGISGPLVLTMSSVLAGLDPKALELCLDLKPALSEEQLQQRIQRDSLAQGRKQLKSLLPGLLPGKLAELFPERCGELDFTKSCAQLSQGERRLFAQRLKALPIRLDKPRPLKEAVITRGGVNLKAVSPSTMGSKLVPGLYFAGELLDVDAFTGGFNLQIAFSTGALAGHSAAQYLTKECI